MAGIPPNMLDSNVLLQVGCIEALAELPTYDLSIRRPFESKYAMWKLGSITLLPGDQA